MFQGGDHSKKVISCFSQSQPMHLFTNTAKLTVCPSILVNCWSVRAAVAPQSRATRVPRWTCQETLSGLMTTWSNVDVLAKLSRLGLQLLPANSSSLMYNPNQLRGVFRAVELSPIISRKLKSLLAHQELDCCCLFAYHRQLVHSLVNDHNQSVTSLRWRWECLPSSSGFLGSNGFEDSWSEKA